MDSLGPGMKSCFSVTSRTCPELLSRTSTACSPSISTAWIFTHMFCSANNEHARTSWDMQSKETSWRNKYRKIAGTKSWRLMTTQPSFSHYPGLCHEVQGRLACLFLCLRIQLWLHQWIDPGSWRIRGPAIIDCCKHLLPRDRKPKIIVQCWEFRHIQAFKSISCMTCPSRSSSSGPGKTVCSPRWDSTYRSHKWCIILHSGTHKDLGFVVETFPCNSTAVFVSLAPFQWLCSRGAHTHRTSMPGLSKDWDLTDNCTLNHQQNLSPSHPGLANTSVHLPSWLRKH